MERRDFLKLTIGFLAGATALAASAQAAPLPPIATERTLVPSHGEGAEPAVVSQDDVDRLKPEEVRWGHHGHGHGHHWGWRHRHWHRRHWGWRHRHWHRHHWHRHRW
ncbi:MAG: twin-arginine translocation (Tat) [Bradyrhizobium sp.]